MVAAGGRLTDWVSLGVLASSVPRDAVDDAVRRALEPQLEVLAAQPDHPAVFAHGDFAPINVVIAVITPHSASVG